MSGGLAAVVAWFIEEIVQPSNAKVFLLVFLATWPLTSASIIFFVPPLHVWKAAGSRSGAFKNTLGIAVARFVIAGAKPRHLYLGRHGCHRPFSSGTLQSCAVWYGTLRARNDLHQGCRPLRC
jgi:hypothetical protein